MSGPEPRSPVELEGRAAEADIIDSRAAGPAALRGGVLRTVAFVLGVALSLVSAPFLIRHLGDEDFGRLSAVLAVIAIVAGLTEGGVNTIALRELSAARDSPARSRLMGDLLGLRLVLSPVGVALGVGFAAVAGYGADLVLGTLLAGIGMVLALVQTLIAAILQSRLHFGLASLVDLIRQAVNTALIIALVVADAGIVAFLAVAIPASLSALVATVLLVRGTIRLRPAFHPSRWMPLLRDTLVFAVAIAVNSLYFRVTLVIMSLVATAAETGHFAVSFRIIEVLIMVPTLLIGAAFPIISRSIRDDRQRFDDGSARMFELGVLVGALMSLALLLAAPFAVELLVGRDDHPAVVVLQIQSAALLASFIASATGFPLLGMRRHRETLIANLVSLAFAAALALALAPGFGARGAAIAAVAADFALAATTTILLVRNGGPRLPLSSLPVAALAAAVGYGAGSLVGVHPLVEASVAAVAFLVVVAASGRFPPEVRDMLGAPRRAESGY